MVVPDVKLLTYCLLNFASDYLHNKEEEPHQILMQVRYLSDYSMVQI